MKKFNSKILFKTDFFLGFNSKKIFKTGFFLGFNSKNIHSIPKKEYLPWLPRTAGHPPFTPVYCWGVFLGLTNPCSNRNRGTPATPLPHPHESIKEASRVKAMTAAWHQVHLIREHFFTIISKNLRILESWHKTWESWNMDNTICNDITKQGQNMDNAIFNDITRQNMDNTIFNS